VDVISELQSRLEVTENPRHGFVPRATRQTLAQAEATIGVRLPASYCRWCEVFGAGELAGYYRIASPMSQQSDFELLQFDARWRGPPEDQLWDGQIESEFLSGMLWFASTIGGESFAWQLREVTDPVANEYRVYYIPRHAPPGACASSFGGWLTEICLTPRENWDPRWEFGRFSR
jgi:hypothetical protein